MTRILTALLLCLAAAAAIAQPSGSRRFAGGCMPAPADVAWAETALRHWRIVERDALKLAPAALPKVILADARCRIVGTESAGGTVAWDGMLHLGKVAVPGGQGLPVGPVSFAAPDPGGGVFFVMTLPSVWRAKGVTSQLGLERLMDAVLLHEMAHTRQFATVGPLLDRLTAQYQLPADISDDSLQQAFADKPEYVRAYEAERDLLFAAADAPTLAEARTLAGQALERLRERRARWFTGPDEKWRHLDDVFLAMEGLGQWVAYWWLTQGAGERLEPAVARREVRRGGRFWSQDEGLALFLVLDRLLPGWQARVFGPEGAGAEALLAAAAAAR